MALAVFIVSVGSPATAQDYIGSEVVEETTDPTSQPFGFGEGQIRGAPVPFRIPSIGAGLGAVGGYIFRADENSDTSYIGLGGFYTENESRGFGLGLSTSFQQNTWKIDALLARADVRYNLGFGDTTIPLQQEFPLAVFGLQYAVVPDNFVGARVVYSEPEFSQTGSVPLPPEIAPDASISVANLELTFDRCKPVVTDAI